MALALAAVVTMGCVQDYMELDPDKIPQASELQVKIDVDQATNYVTYFEASNGSRYVFSSENSTCFEPREIPWAL